jgi:hypothetical protein
MDRDILGGRVVTAAELEAMTPDERHAHFEASIVRDLSVLPPEYLARLRTRALELIEPRDAAQGAPASSSSQQGVPHAS